MFPNLKAGKDVLLEIEIQGALKIKKKFPEAVLIFVTPPSAGELRNRLAGRGTETPEKIAARLSRAAEESKQMDDYDGILRNDEAGPAGRRNARTDSGDACQNRKSQDFD